jgi:hypothetical protein
LPISEMVEKAVADAAVEDFAFPAAGVGSRSEVHSGFSERG